ncbi:ribosome maturation factor RimM [Bacillus alkalicellulosilyticus]|uniref:ribosome maturation factor RimM n=1 Tax=Alkalihalobacterium alkalicellulosilyticum TaxID=1912214 RepID=UPI000997AF12|nr:ribosome maturation factor RimM [Bacillus alkalicellulosilyticus]
MTNWYRVGKIVNTHGIRGEIRVISTTDFEEERFEVGKRLYIEPPGSKTTKDLIRVTVSAHRKHKNFDLLQFEEYHNISQVEPFKGGLLKVEESELGELDEHEYYYHEIIGCVVFTEEGEELGKIKEILSPGANDVWVIQSKSGGKDILIPYIDSVVKEVDVKQKIVKIHLLEGLL